MPVGDDMLLLRVAERRARAEAAGRLFGRRSDDLLERESSVLWELYDPTDDEPVAAAVTSIVDDGRRANLVAFTVVPGSRGRGLGQRIVEEIADALRARGVMQIVAGVAVDDVRTINVLGRAGLRQSRVQPASSAAARDEVWFDLEL
jgi:ribosomal protein S18 acetylase RimI-like enzyme